MGEPIVSRLEPAALAILAAAPDAMVLVDEQGTIVEANELADRLFGYEPGALRGNSVEALVPEAVRERHRAHRREYFLHARTRAMGAGKLDLHGLRVDGSEFPAEISLSPLQLDDGRLTIAAVRDVSERRAAEAERLRLAQAQEALRVRDEFLSIAAHELRTPITALTLRLRTLARTPIESHVRQQVERATRQALRIADLVDTLLDVSRIVAGRLALQLDCSDLVALVADVVEANAEQARVVGSTIALHAPETLSCRIDRARVEQVLENLLSNAIKYGSGRPIEITLERRAEHAEVAVRDHGIGIAPTDTARIFDKFERAVGQRSYAGFGLGLYITRHLVEAHGGTIRVDSVLGEGSCFVVCLPIAGPTEGRTFSAAAG